eukprot:1158491-Pelagomonas_calceolata.AAC.4
MPRVEGPGPGALLVLRGLRVRMGAASGVEQEDVHMQGAQGVRLSWPCELKGVPVCMGVARLSRPCELKGVSVCMDVASGVEQGAQLCTPSTCQSHCCCEMWGGVVGRAQYSGPTMAAAKAVVDAAQGGMVLISSRTFQQVRSGEWDAWPWQRAYSSELPSRFYCGSLADPPAGPRQVAAWPNAVCLYGRACAEGREKDAHATLPGGCVCGCRMEADN